MSVLARLDAVVLQFLVECRSWVNRVISVVDSDFRFSPNSDRIAAWRQPSLGPDLPIGA